MTPSVLFRVAAGPRIGFGHLVRCRTLARALGIEPLVSVRGDHRFAINALKRLGCRPVHGTLATAIGSVGAALVIVDDPDPRARARAIRQARRRGLATASIHDGERPAKFEDRADLSIDGSIAPGPRQLAGVRYALLDPSLERARDLRPRRGPMPRSVLVAFGGGPRRTLAHLVAEMIHAKRRDVQVRVAAGFCPVRSARERRPDGFVSLPIQNGLAGEFDRSTIAVLAGGVTLYEACAVGVPAVALSVVTGQRRAIAAFGRSGAIVDAGHMADVHSTARRITRMAVALLDSPSQQRRLSRRARSLVDAAGARRVAAAILTLVRSQAEKAAA